ncbi:hypothetical protein PENSPDRAFT_757112 [Peniophora sp. CONT]|nr:hypothetical protein PENSPDRAFT_757112 [Peniophora sp. CONT]
MTSLRTAYNLRAPVLKLPRELFVYIVSLLQGIWKAENASNALGWLNITFVCRSWRKTALEVPFLWTTVDLCLCGDWAKAFLERAGSMPISFAMLTETNADEETYAVRALDDYYTGRPWPSVRSIKFPWDAEFSPFVVGDLPTSVYSNTYLQYLANHDTLVYGTQEIAFWDILPSTLLELAIVGHSSYMLDSNELEGLTGLLSRSTSLKSLTINFCFLENLSIPGPIGPPTLQKIAIAAPSHDCLRLLKAIDYPGKIGKLELEMGSCKVPELEAIFQSTHSSSLSFTRELYTTVGIGYKKAKGVHRQKVIAAGHASDSTQAIGEFFEAGCVPLEGYHWQTARGISLRFAVYEYDDEEDAFECMCHVFDWLDLSSVRTLQFHNFHPTIVNVLYYFGSARSVEDLRVVGPDMCDVLAALGLSVPSKREPETYESFLLKPVEDAPDILFPRLKCLHIEGINFDDLDQHDAGASLRVGQTFGLTLSSRALLGGAPQVVVLSNCSLGKEDLVAWSAVVSPTLHGCNVRPVKTRTRRP